MGFDVIGDLHTIEPRLIPDACPGEMNHGVWSMSRERICQRCSISQIQPNDFRAPQVLEPTAILFTRSDSRDDLVPARKGLTHDGSTRV